MQPLSPDTKKRIIRTKKNKGARDQKRGTKRICSDGACAVGKREYYHVKPKANNLSEKKRKVGIRLSPNRRKRIRFRRQKKDVNPPHFRDSSFARSLQKKLDSSFARSLQKKLDSSIARSLQKKLDSSFARSLQKKLDSSIARSLQKKLDSSFARSLQKKLNNPFPGYRRDSSLARKLHQEELDRSLARRLQIEDD